MADYKSPIPLPDEHMRLVGIIAAHWEFIELILERVVAEVMEHEFSRVSLLTANIGFRSKCDLLMVYARPLETAEPTEWKAITQAVEALKKAYTARNTYVHAQWKIDQTTGAIGRTSARTAGGKLAIVDEETPVENLQKAAQQIWDAGENLMTVVQRYGILHAS